MGGDPECKKKVLIAAEAVNAVVETQERDDSYYEQQNYIMSTDYLIFFKKLETRKLYTLSELFTSFWSHVAAHMFNPKRKCRVYIMICDDRSNVPKEKGYTQLKRINAVRGSEQRAGLDAPVPYRQGTVFTKDGIREPGGPDDRIDLRRLGVSRGKDGASNVCNELWDAFRERIDPLVQRYLKPDQMFVFDYDKAGPWVFAKDSPPIQETGDHAHCLGEAEPAAIWWIHYFHAYGAEAWVREMDFHINSSDGDHYALFWGYFDTWNAIPHKKGHVWWHCDPGTKRVNLVTMTPKYVSLFKFQSPLHAVCGFVEGGTDYTNKSLYAHGFGFDAIQEAVKRVDLGEIIRSKTIASTTEQDGEKWIEEFFTRFLLELYDTKLGRVKVTMLLPDSTPPKAAQEYTIEEVRAEATRKGGSKLRFPSALEFNFQRDHRRWLIGRYMLLAHIGERGESMPPPDPQLLLERSLNEKSPSPLPSCSSTVKVSKKRKEPSLSLSSEC